ncbi:MAG TPA: hypothetical protein VKQ52_16470, partial [Puia sp.]|nr:hypothetical protein [Puia sp.]
MKILLSLFLLMPAASACAGSTDSIPLPTGQGPLLTPFLAPGYSPDIQFTLTGGGIFSFRTK